jgi:nicotinamide riboside transporter PnuC
MHFDLIGEIFDTCASLLGKYGRWLNAKGRRICFIVWGVVALYWVVRDLELQLYSQAFFCLCSIALDIYGYLNWKKKKIGK